MVFRSLPFAERRQTATACATAHVSRAKVDIPDPRVGNTHMAQIAILDVDGTLVDTNYHHAIAWYRAFRRHFITVPVWRIHRHIGMGGDQLVAAVAGADVEARVGDRIREAESELYRQLIDEVQAMEGSRELIEDLRAEENVVVLASSAKDWEVEHYIELLDAAKIVDAWTTSADVESTKPEAAKRAGVDTLAVLTGGFSEQELRDAGAREVYTSVQELRESLARTPLSA
jgi:phosphoglycolate phosphatase-like HAD superfamily hydrolase